MAPNIALGMTNINSVRFSFEIDFVASKTYEALHGRRFRLAMSSETENMLTMTA